MKYPDNHDPRQTITAAHAMNGVGDFFLPYKSAPRKIDSRKNANMPSIASGCPTIEPLLREKAAQFVPNSNSIGMPVTTPAAKLIAKIVVQKRAAAAAPSSPR